MRTDSMFFDNSTQSPSKNFIGRKLLLSDNRRIKLLKNGYLQRSKQKVKIQLLQNPSRNSQQKHQQALRTFCNDMIKSQDLVKMSKRQNHDSLVKKRIQDIVPLRKIKTDRKERLMSKLKLDIESEKNLDRAASALNHKKSQQSNVDKIKYQNLHNPFFKSFKSRIYLKSKQRLRSQQQKQRYEQKNGGEGFNSSRSLVSYFSELEQKGNFEQAMSKINTMRLKSISKAR